jgi:hypothetical protein
MKNFKFSFISALLGALTLGQAKAQTHEHHQNTKVSADTTKKSIPQETHAMVGENHFTIKYYAPAVRGRVIWGGLVSYGQVWVTGAHSATSIEFSQNIKIKGKVVPAGKYAFFTIPNKKTWTIILNKNWEQHLADEYNLNEDVIRIEVKPKKLKQTVERLNYAIEAKTSKNGILTVSWEKIAVNLDFINEP